MAENVVGRETRRLPNLMRNRETDEAFRAWQLLSEVAPEFSLAVLFPLEYYLKNAFRPAFGGARSRSRQRVIRY